MADLLQFINDHNISPHLLADGIAFNGLCLSIDTASKSVMTAGISNIAEWISSNCLQLNMARLMHSGVPWHVYNVSYHWQISSFSPTLWSHHTGFMILTFTRSLAVPRTTHMLIGKVVTASISVVHQMRIIRWSVTKPPLLMLVMSVVQSWLVYDFSTLAGLSA